MLAHLSVCSLVYEQSFRNEATITVVIRSVAELEKYRLRERMFDTFVPFVILVIILKATDVTGKFYYRSWIHFLVNCRYLFLNQNYACVSCMLPKVP